MAGVTNIIPAVPETKSFAKAGNPLAFPTHGYGSGMSLRDYYAGIAMQAGFRDGSYEIVAANAYRMADAMLEERRSHA